MSKHSAGILMYRRRGGVVEVLLGHPGGPFWAGKDDGAWSFPKGEHGASEDGLAAARREFTEETGFVAQGEFVALGSVKQASGKVIEIWAVEGDCDPRLMKSNTFSMEWPPKSGRQQEFAEIDRVGWFAPEAAALKLHKGQVEFLTRLLNRLGIAWPTTGG